MGFVVANYIAYAVSMASIKKSLMHFYKHQVRDLWSGLIASSVAGLAIITLHLLKIHLLLKISLMGVVFISIYGLMMFVFFLPNGKLLKTLF